MISPTGQTSITAQHWDSIYRTDPGHTGSWYQHEPQYSLRLLDAANIRPGHGVIDVGGGESRLADRAVFHSLTSRQGRATYLATLERALALGGRAVIGTFAADGAEQCSGLPVARYSPEELAAQFGDAFRVFTTEWGKHYTPTGAVQPFTWLVLARD